jgi:VCBS repeat-containing protein
VDGTLTGTKWATSSLTFSFPSDATYYGANYGSEPLTNFKAFTSAQQSAVRDILKMYASVANLTFTEITETATQHATLRYAESDAPSTAWAYYPNTSEIGGDAWFNVSKHYYDNPGVGTYGWATLIHETGHALGLKHPHEVMGSFGIVPLDKDSLEYTVMSYRSYVGGSAGSYTVAWTDYPQTLMMLDIAAMQAMYGANYTTNSSDTVYSWNPLTGQESINGVAQTAPAANRIFMTVWDGGGHDTYDFSNYSTNLNINLSPGAWSTVSTAQLGNLGGGHYAAGNIANALLYQGNIASLIEDAVGGSGNDTIVGNVANNKLTGGAGADQLDGGAGTDTAVFSGLSSDHSWVQNADGTWTVTDLRAGSPDGTDTLTNIENLQFIDLLVAIGTAPSTPVNSVPIITSTSQGATLAEWADGSTNESGNTPHTATGAITYTDADATDTHIASFRPQGSGYLGTFSLNTGSIDTAHSVGWSFSVSDRAIDFLLAGQTLTQNYDVTVDDGHGGFTTQIVSIVITGAADATTTSSKGKGVGKKGGAVGNGLDADSDAHGNCHASAFDLSNDQIPTPAVITAAAFDELTFLQLRQGKAVDLFERANDAPHFAGGFVVIDAFHHSDFLHA